jgi:hypothetical protein
VKSSGRRASVLRGCALHVCAIATLASACADPNTYGTPRTTPTGEFHGSLAAVGVGTLNDGKSLDWTIQPPTYTLRYGVAERTDLGFRFAGLSTLGVDAKQNFARGKLDLAVDPMLQWFGGLTAELPAPRFHTHLPLLVGLNLSRSVSIVATPGVAGAFGFGAVGSNTPTTARIRRVAETGLFGRLGLGLDLRLSESVAIHPEVTAMQHIGDPSVTLVYFGIGVAQGALPSYEDIP